MEKEQKVAGQDPKQNELKLRNNGVFLADSQIAVLKRNKINYEEYANPKSLLFAIETELNENPYAEEELEIISEQLAEISYYHQTKK